MVNKIGRYSKIRRAVDNYIHVYDVFENKIICTKKGLKSQERKTVYETEKDMLKEFTKWTTHCKKCAKILKSRIKEKETESKKTCITCKYHEDNECLLDKTIDNCDSYEKEIGNYYE